MRRSFGAPANSSLNYKDTRLRTIKLMTTGLEIIKMRKKCNKYFWKISFSPLAEEIAFFAHNISLEKWERIMIGAL